MKCVSCGRTIPDGAKFCSGCGSRQKKNILPLILIPIISLIIIGIVIVLVRVIGNSPVENVSKKIYNRGVSALNEYNSDETKQKVFDYYERQNGENLDDGYMYIEGINFVFDVGKNPTKEEILFGQVIEQIWKARYTCYCHDAIMNHDYGIDNKLFDLAVTMYKDKVDNYRKEIDKAEIILKKAKNINDINEANSIMKDVWNNKFSE